MITKNKRVEGVVFDFRSLDLVEPYACLTFDDGPDCRHTLTILELLRQNNSKATFFVVGEFVIKHPEIIKQMAEEGHEIGNHTFAHPDLRYLTPEQIKSEVKKTEHHIFEITGKKTVLFRPPYGKYTLQTVDVIKKLGYEFVVWSHNLYVRDWELPGVDILVQRVMNNTVRGSVILLHDGGGHRDQTIETIRIAVPQLREQGLRFVTVSEMINKRKTR
ncbi:polysaccharide deacetylase family protein [Paenibacillus sp. FJAT-26967]|uniref:polysaccharide deacetylase family protein n=1 Tax=Paenibacillus sp. FJAT-26967 TaxID=1729690 RepID=UPI0008395B0D|nr:polysaccharide deacetylase family protein [Paenibacillus sp. FJAT-26967]